MGGSSRCESKQKPPDQCRIIFRLIDGDDQDRIDDQKEEI